MANLDDLCDKMDTMHGDVLSIKDILQGPLGHPEEGVIAQVQDNKREIGYLKKWKDSAVAALRARRTWLIGAITAVTVSIVSAVFIYILTGRNTVYEPTGIHRRHENVRTQPHQPRNLPSQPIP